MKKEKKSFTYPFTIKASSVHPLLGICTDFNADPEANLVAFLYQESSLKEIDYVTNDDLERLYRAVEIKQLFKSSQRCR